MLYYQYLDFAETKSILTAVHLAPNYVDTKDTDRKNNANNNKYEALTELEALYGKENHQ